MWSGQIRSGFLGAFDTIKRAVSFPLADKYLVNEHHVIRKSHDAKQRKNVLTWCISMYHVFGFKQTRVIKNVTLKAAKKISGCRGLLGRVRVQHGNLAVTIIFFVISQSFRHSLWLYVISTEHTYQTIEWPLPNRSFSLKKREQAFHK